MKSYQRQALALLLLILSLVTIQSCSDTDTPTGGGGGGGGIDTTEDTLLQVTSELGQNPTVSPSGNLVAYELGGFGVAIIDLRDSTLDTVLAFARNPDWGTDEDTIACNSSGLKIILANGEPAFQYSNSLNTDTPDWNSNGHELVAHGNSPDGIYLINFITGFIWNLACTVNGADSCQGEHPTFSPDGQEIAFENGLEILKVNRNGGIADTLVANLNDVTEPSWSPDGNWVAFVMQDSTSNANHIWVVDSRGMGAGIHQITSGVFSDRNPAWGPNSDRIFFDRTDLTGSGVINVWRILFDKTPLE